MKIGKSKFERVFHLGIICLAGAFLLVFGIAVLNSPDLTETLADYLATFLPDSKIQIQRNIVYSSPNGKPLLADLYRQIDQKGTHPAVVLVHGGSWAKGDKNDISEITCARYLASRGFIALVIDYRLGIEGAFPNDVIDVKDALRFLLSKKDEWSIDPNLVYVFGSSSGASTAMLAAYMPDSKISNMAKDSREKPVKVTAVVSFSGPTDLRKESSNPYVKSYIKDYASAIQGKQNEDKFLLASSITYATSAVATVFVHGSSDKNVPIAHSMEMMAALQKQNIPAKLITVEDGDHFLGIRSKKLALEQSFEFLRQAGTQVGRPR